MKKVTIQDGIQEVRRSGLGFARPATMNCWRENKKASMANNKNYSNSDMENLIRQKLQELEQLRHNLLHNLRTSSGQAKAYQQMSLEVVEGCREVLQELLEN
ncbi:MAG: hypothetical protein H6559_00335 [Lewinellaceae bacterium]|nr:hypothetical protein [Lewinellaceae bacterium]